jgi:hypothetical protein
MIKKIVKKLLGIETYIDNSNDPEAIRNRHSEIKRYHIINHLISKYGFKSYLEIGVLKGENIRKVTAAKKDGVDPGAERHVAPEVNFRMTSDDFFELLNSKPDIKYDIVFIDGLHHAEQVKKDIYNSLLHLSPGGFIILHDCNPISYESQLVPRKTTVWNGNPWKAFVEFKGQHPELNCCVVDTDYGVGVIKADKIGTASQFKVPEWQEFDKRRNEFLNLISWEQFQHQF